MNLTTVQQLKDACKTKANYLAVQEVIDNLPFDDIDFIDNFWDNSNYILDSEIREELSEFGWFNKLISPELSDRIEGNILFGEEYSTEKAVIAADLDCGFYVWYL